MFYLYVLENRDGRHYIGFTENTEERLSQHNTGRVKSTKHFRPWILAYSEVFSDKKTARQKELFLKKTAKARQELFSRIKHAPIV